MTRPFAPETLVVVLAASIFAATPLTLPVAADDPIRGAATDTPAVGVACCGSDEVDAEPEAREQTLVVQNDPAEPPANKSNGGRVNVKRTIANRNPKAGGPDSKRKWHVWVTKREDKPAPDRFEKIAVHVEPYSRGDCGKGRGRNPRCATATIWLYEAIAGNPRDEADYILKLAEVYRKIDLTIIKTDGPTRGLAFRAEVPRTKADGTRRKGEIRTFLITGARHGEGNEYNHRTLRVTTFLRKNGLPEAGAAGKSERGAISECIDYVDDAYYEEEDYSGDYQYPDEDESPYDDEPYDYEE